MNDGNNISSSKDKFKDTLNSQVNFMDVFFTTIRRWPWLLASVVICMGLAWIYVKRSAPVYTRTASILIKGDGNSPSASSDMDIFASMGLVAPTSTNINDELNKLQSPDVMSEVVRRLNLDMSYEDKGSWHNNMLYGSGQPFRVVFPNLLENESVRLTVNVDQDGAVSLSDMKLNKHSVDSPEGTYSFGDTIATGLGPVVVSPTPYMHAGQEYSVLVTRMPTHAAVTQFTNEFSAVRPDQKANVITLTVNDRSAQRAEDILNAVISVYNEKWLQDRNKIAVATSRFINERLGVIESELGHVDTDISNFQAENLVPDVQQAATMYMDENRAADSNIAELENRQQVARHLRSYVVDPDRKYEVIPANVGIDNTALVELIGQYNDAAVQRERYVQNTSGTHPVVNNLESSMSTMRQAITTSIDAYIDALDTNIRNLRGVRSVTNARLAANPKQAKYLLTVERQQKVKESLYLFLLQKREENELSQAFTAYNTEVITRPGGSLGPTSPKTAYIMLGAFLLGLLIPFGVNYVREYGNNKVRGRKDVENLSVPFLGEIPECKAGKGEPKNRIVVKQGKRNIVNEAFRVLRTNLGFMTSHDQGCTVVMMTSFNPGSGKTFLTMNLAVSLAIKGKRVLVIDGDLRRATASTYVNSPAKGLSNYLVGSVTDINSVIVADSIVSGLSVLPVGTIPPNPAELLETRLFAELVTNLRQNYDYILIDCPPVEMMADAQIINTVVDRSIFVIRSGLFVRAMLPDLERIYNEHKFRNMCLILNGTSADDSRVYGKYGYGYGYGYGDYSHYTTKD